MLAAKSEAARAGVRMINRIQNQFKRKAVYRVHADRAQELIGDRARQQFEDIGVTVTSTVGHESNANGRAERAVLFFLQKVRTLLSTNIRSENFQKIGTMLDFCSATFGRRSKTRTDRRTTMQV